jgi:hypothetical protein
MRNITETLAIQAKIEIASTDQLLTAFGQWICKADWPKWVDGSHWSNMRIQFYVSQPAAVQHFPVMSENRL